MLGSKIGPVPQAGPGLGFLNPELTQLEPGIPVRGLMVFFFFLMAGGGGGGACHPRTPRMRFRDDLQLCSLFKTHPASRQLINLQWWSLLQYPSCCIPLH